MSYDVLVAIVVTNLLVTLVLWFRSDSRKKANLPLGPNKKAATALWDSNPVVPRHNPPKTAGGQFSGLASDEDRLFFADFREFADVLNWWLADEFNKSSFRLEDLPDGDRSLNVNFDDGPMLGRSFALYCNQTRIGRLEICPGLDYTTANPHVFTEVQIEWPRLLSYHELVEFLSGIAAHVTSTNRGEFLAARQNIHFAMTKTLWGEYRISQYGRNLDDAEDWGELDVSFIGVAEFYMSRKYAPAFRDRR